MYTLTCKVMKDVHNLQEALPCVCSGKSFFGTVVPVDLELLCSVHAFQGSKPLEGNFGGSCHKLQEAGTISLIKGTQGPPEPLDLCGEEKINTTSGV